MSYDIVKENVPPFTKRVGDYVIQGSNNSIIILGTDRANVGSAPISSGLGAPGIGSDGKLAGSIHMITGRIDPKGDPDFDRDRAYFYLSMKTEVDKNLGTKMQSDVGQMSAAIIKSDAARLVVRNDLKIVVDGSDSYIWIKRGEMVLKTEKGFVRLVGDKIIVDAGTIELGEGAGEHVILGDSMVGLYNSHVHPTAAGTSGVPVIPMGPSQLSQRKVLVK